jgi:hypothetical protein
MLELRRVWNEQLIESREQFRALERGVAQPGPKDKPNPRDKKEK